MIDSIEVVDWTGQRFRIKTCNPSPPPPISSTFSTVSTDVSGPIPSLQRQ